jgi:hypothetical protein
MWILKISIDLSTYNQGPSPRALKNLTFLHSTQLFPTQNQKNPTVFHKNEWSTYIQIYCLRKGQILFCKKTTLILLKRYLKLISSKCLSFGLTTYLLCLVGVFFNRKSAFLWITTVFLFSPTCSFVRTRQTSYNGFWKKNEKKLARPINFTFRYIGDVLSPNNSTFDDFVDCIYPIELELKDTTVTSMSASCIDLHIEFDS